MTAAPRGADPDPPVRRPMDSVFIDSPTVNLVIQIRFLFYFFKPKLNSTESNVDQSIVSAGWKKEILSIKSETFFSRSCCCCTFPRRVTKGVSPNLTDTTARGSDGWNEEKYHRARPNASIEWPNNAKRSTEGNEWCSIWEKKRCETLVFEECGLTQLTDEECQETHQPECISPPYIYIYTYYLSRVAWTRRAKMLDWSSSCRQKLKG